MAQPNVLIIGAFGQLGLELLPELSTRFGYENVLAADIQANPTDFRSVQLDVTDRAALAQIIDTHQINQIYHLAALLSATGEKNPKLAWQVNMDGLINVLDLAVEKKIEKVFWPSSIAVFGPSSPKMNTPQQCSMEPITMYGITKLAGERLCEYYYLKHKLDIRSIRYPGLIGYKSHAGGGTTDYAVEIFEKALTSNHYNCFLKPDSHLPMLYMDDAVRGTLALMEAPADKITVRSSYNLSGMSFSPGEIVEEIKKHLPSFQCEYHPDFRQAIADNWPKSIDDSIARRDWGWKPDFDLSALVSDMITNISARITTQPA
jgi:nucleoside-diphosphate-sugar epimerase